MASASSFANRSTDSTHCVCREQKMGRIHTYGRLRKGMGHKHSEHDNHPVLGPERGDDSRAQSSLPAVNQHSNGRHLNIRTCAVLLASLRMRAEPTMMRQSSFLRRVGSYCWSILRPRCAASSTLSVPLTAEHYAVKRGDYAQVKRQTTSITIERTVCVSTVCMVL